MTAFGSHKKKEVHTMPALEKQSDKKQVCLAYIKILMSFGLKLGVQTFMKIEWEKRPLICSDNPENGE